MKIMITGGSGFIGSALCRYILQADNHNILNIDKLTYASDERALESAEQNPRYQFSKTDICDQVKLHSLFAWFKPDAVIHLAAESHVDRSITGSENFIQSNIVGTYRLLEVARKYWDDLDAKNQKVFRFLHVSTDEVYGSLGDEGAFHEQSPTVPSSPYSASKAASDALVTAWYKTYGFPALISNCSNNYGPYQFPEKFIPTMIINALAGKPLPVYGDGKNVRDWLHVEDHVRALLTILEKGKPGEKYNVGGNCERANIDVAHLICDFLDQKQPSPKTRRDLIRFVTDRLGHDFRYAIDSSKIQKELGWLPQENFDTGLEKTIDWYLNNKQWWEPMVSQSTLD